MQQIKLRLNKILGNIFENDVILFLLYFYFIFKKKKMDIK